MLRDVGYPNIRIRADDQYLDILEDIILVRRMKDKDICGKVLRRMKDMGFEHRS